LYCCSLSFGRCIVVLFLLVAVLKLTKDKDKETSD
jgi:hypothetical protein